LEPMKLGSRCRCTDRADGRGRGRFIGNLVAGDVGPSKGPSAHELLSQYSESALIRASLIKRWVALKESFAELIDTPQPPRRRTVP